MFAIKGAPANQGTQNYQINHMLILVLICHFFMGSIMWLYQTQKLINICATVTDVAN